MVGTSSAVRALLEQVKVAGRDRYPLWIYGELGVERDLVVRLIHEASPWATGGFLAIDVGVLPPALVRREIFGAEAGAMPALPAQSEGAMGRTRMGTLLLEGVETVSKEVQEELSDALGGRYRRLGGQTELSVECRVIASGAAPLDQLVRAGRLIRPLADRLSTLEIRVPPLRERREDVPLLAAQALVEAREDLERQTGRPCPARNFSLTTQQRLASYDWPGNERELKEQIRAAVSVCTGEEVQPEDLLLGWSSPERIPSFRAAKRAFENEYVTRLLRLCRGNISQAARLARKDRKDFYDVMRRNSINPAEFRK